MSRPPLGAVLGTALFAPLFMGAVIVYVPYALTGWHIGPPFFGWSGFRWVGVDLVLLSVPLLFDFLVRFVREGHGTPMPLAPPRRLVVRGVFRFVRNPGYIGALAAIAGQAFLFGSRDVMLYAGVMAIVFHVFVVGYEEPTLRRTFGAEYEEYCRDVPRWMPRLPRARRLDPER